MNKAAKKLYNECLKLWKDYCFKRDGDICQVRILRPDVEILHAGPLQVDHCITRANKWTFFDVSNGTVVCASCNRAKGFKQMSIDRAIDWIVIRREGSDKFSAMVESDHRKHPCHEWGKVHYFEKVRQYLLDMHKDIDACRNAIGGTSV